VVGGALVAACMLYDDACVARPCLFFFLFFSFLFFPVSSLLLLLSISYESRLGTPIFHKVLAEPLKGHQQASQPASEQANKQVFFRVNVVELPSLPSPTPHFPFSSLSPFIFPPSTYSLEGDAIVFRVNMIELYFFFLFFPFPFTFPIPFPIPFHFPHSKFTPGGDAIIFKVIIIELPFPFLSFPFLPSLSFSFLSNIFSFRFPSLFRQFFPFSSIYLHLNPYPYSRGGTL
jgi:hypothetical protein